LHVVPESLHVWAVEQLGYHLIIGPLAGRPSRDVTLQAAGVGSKTSVRISEVGDRVRRSAGQVTEDWTKIDRPERRS
jgi:hypothetical protein